MAGAIVESTVGGAGKRCPLLAAMHLRREQNYWAHRTADIEGNGK